MKTQYKLKNAMLMMALAAIYPMQSFAAAGVAQFSAGDVTLRRGTGADPLVKGRDIESGDAIVTGASGRAQVRFSDGGLVSLQPNSQFNISNYADKNDPKQDAFLVDLLRGGMRAVTGLIGKRNRENYKVTTTTATIGIRGSAFNMAYNPDGTLSVSTELDEIEVCTRAGCVGLKAGESALVVTAQDAPVRTSTRATLPTPEPRQEPQVVANQPGIVPSSPTAQPPAPPPPPPVDTSIISGVAFSGMGQLAGTQLEQSDDVLDGDYDYTFNKSRVDQRLYTSGSVKLDANGKPEYYVSTGNATGRPVGTTAVVSTTGTVGAGDFMLLGTWSGATWTEGENTITAGPTAFVIGQPSSSTALTSLVGQRADYTFAAGTPVFSSVTGAEPGQILESSKLTLDFLAAGNYLTADINVRMPGNAQAGNFNPAVVVLPTTSDYNLRGSATASGAGFAGNLSVSSQNCVMYGYSCGTGVFNGFLSGDHAEKAGVSFSADTYDHGYINGAATFERGPLTTTPQNFVVSSGLVGAFMDGGGRYHGGTYLGENYNNLDQFTFNGDQLVKYRQNESGSVTIERTTVPGTFGGIGRLADSDFIGWGNWVTATETNTPTYGYGSPSSNLLDALHYVVGKPTAQMPLQGQASYALVGGTNPTATGGSGGSQVGTLAGGNMNVNFSTGDVGVNIVTQFANGGVININGSASVSGSSFRSYFNSGNCTEINGVFVGTMAYRAGLVYGANTGIGRVTGAAAFQRTWSSGLSTSSGGY
ncbi:MAG: hypothetical protein EOO28_33480 [Comamonadaceae bacterium]|nr:MAG: hypothetical protein EOO28_33480 [Comamonadaceae bacterium]